MRIKKFTELKRQLKDSTGTQITVQEVHLVCLNTPTSAWAQELCVFGSSKKSLDEQHAQARAKEAGAGWAFLSS